MSRNRVNNRVNNRGWIFFAPHEIRSGHGVGQRQSVPHRGGKIYMNNPPLQNSAPIMLGAQPYTDERVENFPTFFSSRKGREICLACHQRWGTMGLQLFRDYLYRLRDYSHTMRVNPHTYLRFYFYHKSHCKQNSHTLFSPMPFIRLNLSGYRMGYRNTRLAWSY